MEFLCGVKIKCLIFFMESDTLFESCLNGDKESCLLKQVYGLQKDLLTDQECRCLCIEKQRRYLFYVI